MKIGAIYPPEQQQQILKFVESLKEQSAKLKQCPFGLYKSKFIIPDDCNEALSKKTLG